MVETIAQRSQNIKWETTVDKKKVGHKLIRRVNLDQYYARVTCHDDAFYQMCMALPSIIKKATKELEGSIVPHDTPSLMNSELWQENRNLNLMI